MKISDVEKITGLTAKAIRLYEEKGLIAVDRQDNSYRDYNEDAVTRLKQIKLLRDIGVGISEIILYFNKVISLQELLNKRKKELEKESAVNQENYFACINMLDEIFVEDTISRNKVVAISRNKTLIGIDIGTTTISAVVIDAEKNVVLENYSVENNSKLASDSDFSEHDVEIIMGKAKRIAEYLVKAYPNTLTIGVTGQMHGVLYLDKNGISVSPLYNWQDGRGNRKLENNMTYCEQIEALTGYKVHSGYGFSTLYYNKINGLEPKEAETYCTVMDYVAMQLGGRKTPLIHPTNAASLGLFNIHENCFDSSALEKLGLNSLNIPEVALNDDVVGYFDKIPVVVAIGDNQASFFGSVKQDNNALVNFGTGSQISAIVDSFEKVNENLEIRPFLFGKYLICGSALCGGKAYSILEKFFSAFANEITEGFGSAYEVMNSLAKKAYNEKQRLKVSTLFCGTRNNPDLRGSIADITDENFTPQNLALGFLQGMVDELKTYFDYMKVDSVSGLTASGNAVQKNPVLRDLLKDTFDFEVSLTDSCEEASIGAALYAGISCEKINKEQIEEIIKYK